MAQKGWRSGRAGGLSAVAWSVVALSVVLAACLTETPAYAYSVLVSNEKDNALSVIDSETLDVVQTLPVGRRPRGITLSKDKSKLYICASDSDTVQVMDVSRTAAGQISGKLLYNLPSGEDPEQFALSPDDRALYISNENNAAVTVVDTQTRKVIAQYDVGVEPEGMAVSPDGRWAVNTSETTSMVHWIDTQAGKVVDSTLVDQRPRHAEFSPDGRLLWVSSEVGGSVTVIDVATRQPVKTLRFAVRGVKKDQVQPVGIRMTADGTRAFVALGPANHIAVVNTATYETEALILVGRRVWHMEISPDGKRLYAANGVSGDVSVVALDDLSVVRSVKVGRYPWGVAIVP